MAAMALPLAKIGATVLGKIGIAGAGKAATLAAGAGTAAAAGKAVHDVSKGVRSMGKTGSQAVPTTPLMPDADALRRERRRAEASRVGGGRASTVLSQGGGQTLGPS